MERTHTISRPSYGKQPSVSSYSVLDGLTVKYRPPNIPKPVHLAGITLPTFPGQKGFNYDFSTENYVIEECKSAHVQIAAQASITKQLRQRMEKAAAAQRKPTPPLVVVPQGPTLTPIPAPVAANGNGTGGSAGSSSNLNLRDFETDGDPFETVTLKSINERAELESIWGTPPQVELQPTTTTQSVPQPQPAPLVTAQPAPGVPLPSGQLVGMNQSLVGGVSQTDRAPSPDAQGRPVPKPRRFVPPKQGGSEPQQLGSSPAAPPQGLGSSGPSAIAPMLMNVSERPPPVITQTPPLIATQPQPPVVAQPQPPVVAQPQPPVVAQPQPPVVAQTPPTVVAQPQPPVVTQPQPPVVAQPQPPVVAQTPPTVATQPQPPVVSQTPAPVTAAASTAQLPARPSPPPIAPKPKGSTTAVPPVVPPPYSSTHTARTRSPTNLPPLNHQPVVLNNHTAGLPSLAGQPPHAMGGIRVLPAIGLTAQLHNPTSTTGGMDIPPAYTASSVSSQLPPPVYSAPSVAAPPPPRPVPTPLSVPSQPPPPVYSAPSVAAPPPPRPAPAPPQYKLEDVRENLSDAELDSVLQVAAMGFDEARVARTYKRLKKDQAKVLDFLFLVGQLEELGFNGNSAETALINCDGKTDKAVDYLKQVVSYKEMGYKEKGIHDAYQKSDKDWDKALDILLQQQ